MGKWDGVQPAVQRWRFNPFTEASQYITLADWETEDIADDTHTVSLDAQGNYTIQAREAIYDDGAILLQYDSGGWQDAIEVGFEPTAVGQFRVDYKYRTGKIQFHSGMNGMDIRLKYTAMGTIVCADPLVNKVMVQDSQYGHEWMHWHSEDGHEILDLAIGSYSWLMFYFPLLVNPTYGKYSHWPPLKCQDNDDTLIGSWLGLSITMLWGGCSASPALGYAYVGGILVRNNNVLGDPNLPKDCFLSVDMHGE